MAMFAIYSETDFSLDFYNRSSTPAVGSTFNDKIVTKVYTNISASNPAWKSDGNVKKIVSTTAVDTVSPTRTSSWYNGAAKLTSVNLANLDTSNVTDTNYMFGGCSALRELDVSNFNTSKITNMRCMFYNCSSLQEIDVSNFDVSSVTNFEYVFYACIQANIIGVNLWNTSNGTSMKSMFYKCASTPHFDLSGWNTSKVTDMSWMFNRCAATIDFTGWDTSKVTTFNGMFASSFILYLDLSSFDVSACTNFNSMFFNSISLRTILVSYDWNKNLKEGADDAWMFENCFMLMGDISYSDMNDAAEPEDYEHMTSKYAMTKGGYLTQKQEEADEDEALEHVYLVQSDTLHDLADSIRSATGVPQKMALKNFSKILSNQISSLYPAALKFQDEVHDSGDDVGTTGQLSYIGTDMQLNSIALNRFSYIPIVLKNSILALQNIINLNEDTELICTGDITRLGDSLAFIIYGDATIKIVEKEMAPMTFNLRRPRPTTTTTPQHIIDDFDKEEVN